MTPRTAVVAYEMDIPTSETLSLAKNTGYSGFPVCRDSLDHVVVYVHSKDMFFCEGNGLLMDCYHPCQTKLSPVNRGMYAKYMKLLENFGIFGNLCGREGISGYFDG